MRSHRFDGLPILPGNGGPPRECFCAVDSPATWTAKTIKREEIPFHQTIPANATLLELIERFLGSEKTPFLFLTVNERIAGLVTVADLNSRPVQVWLFALLCEFETELASLIDHTCSEEDICFFMKEEGRECFDRDRQNGVDNRPVSYLYLPAMLQILKERPEVAQRLGTTGAQKLLKMKDLGDLRNRVMHPLRLLVDAISSLKDFHRMVRQLREGLYYLRQGR
jgi:hypothetical protein